MDYYFVPLLIGTFFNRQYHVYNEENPLDQKIISIGKEYISDREKKIQLLKELSITRYISTYIHSLMVAKLCKVYLKYVILEKPETLIGVMDCKTAEEVQDRKSELEEFFWNGALLHDIGKNDMIDIISTEYRKLDDNEFGIIRKHPERGAKILEGEEQFESFISLILGHHRSYDGRRGYPMDFDNASSSWKPLIDILTLCDCMEAATDFLSRNYERTKTPDAVLGEFETGAGTFYNPVYVELLKENHQLFKEISEIVGKGRFRTYYEIYKDHFERKDEK